MGRHRNAQEHAKKKWTLWRISLAVFLAIWAIVGIGGVSLMWPGDKEPNISPDFYTAFPLGHTQLDATIITQQPGACTTNEAGALFDTSPRITPGADTDCTWFIAEITEGDNAGMRTLLVNAGQKGEPDLEIGTRIRVIESTDAEGNTRYAFGDLQRANQLIIWAIAMAISIIALALMRGVRALIGLFLTMGVVAYFTLPALLIGANPIAIAVFSGALILLFVVLLVHGFNWKSASALGGTMMALGISALLATAAIEHTNLRGLGEEGNLYILLYLPDVNVIGLMLCGFTIGALGVLNDVAIAQASTVNELAELNPDATPWQLFVSAMQVGRDHISSMVYTLVLTYTGASLPTMLLLSVTDRPIGQILTSDVMATELMRSAVGAFALTLAVPITTIFAAFTVPDTVSTATGAKEMKLGGHHH
ncbi:YibE/F family protein [Corynebacterium felinum]|uniref:Membrane protein n=1 Tax=Corynebacterium felinum TaxID=131318 RepID=A0ABU2B5S9_9CORY|nr:YibE/F family protein [Corynebacterium felinum]MDF5821734.1 YibE/F family protein [Corynebacterium felinum]MDR7353975.1 putative membrane protein [Corynebacterium felinum]WJY96148.1 YibE/F-like protein [Corynebacterium felinum]